MPEADKRFVLSALDTRVSGAVTERVAAARAAIALFSDETGEPLSKKRYERWRVARQDSRSVPSATFIQNTWNGSWSHAMSQLGLQPAPDHAARRMAATGAPRTDEELLEHLRECAAELGRTPMLSEYGAWARNRLDSGRGSRYLGEQAYRQRFADWPRAVQAAGLRWNGGRTPYTRGADWSSDRPLQLLREAAAEVGAQRLRHMQYVAWRNQRLAEQRIHGDYTAIPSAQSLADHHGGWLAALAAAGLVSDAAAQNMRLGAGRAFTDEQLGARDHTVRNRVRRPADVAPVHALASNSHERRARDTPARAQPGRAASGRLGQRRASRRSEPCNPRRQ